MKGSRSDGRSASSRWSVSILGVVLAAWSFSGCEGRQTEICVNQKPLTFHGVLERVDCADCAEYEIRSPIIGAREIHVRSEPDFVVDGCDVQEVEVWLDAVGLTLGREPSRGLGDLKRRVIERGGPDALVAIFLEGQGRPISVLHARELGLYMLMSGFESPEQVWGFVGELGAGDARIVENRSRVIEGSRGVGVGAAGSDDRVAELERRASELEALERRIEAEVSAAETRASAHEGAASAGE